MRLLERLDEALVIAELADDDLDEELRKRVVPLRADVGPGAHEASDRVHRRENRALLEEQQFDGSVDPRSLECVDELAMLEERALGERFEIIDQVAAGDECPQPGSSPVDIERG